MKFIMPFIFSFASILIHAQSKQDYTWLMGLEPGGSDYPINCMNVLDFGDINGLKITKELIDSRFFLSNVSASNSDGNLLFYSNGCYIKDANHQIMPNGNHLNPGSIYDDNCPDGGYTSQGIIILPSPGNPNKYYLFHQAFEIYNESPFVRTNRLYYTVVDMQQNNGMGDVILKNQVVLGTTQYTGIQAVRHANNNDWWVIAMKQNGNKYYKVLLTENGISEVDSQTIGDLLSINGGGQMCFSPDGTKFAKYDFMDQLMLFDFDRSTGLLSNYRQMDIDTNELAFCGLAFSPNSKRLYLSTQQKLWQLDLEAPDILASKTLVGEFDGFVYEFFNLLFPVLFQRMQLGPDYKIYMTSHGPVAYMHVINNPDEPGLACNFVQRGLELPCSVNYSIPNFPNYRLGTGYPVCDSNIVYVSAAYESPPLQGVRVWPNPASYELHAENNFAISKPATLWLFNATGQAVRQWELSSGQLGHTFSLEGLADGMYFWKVGSEGQQIDSGKLVIIK
ncbi:MAG: T9SS type A sorting domain-containing protein [Saprospiraceae bacterium]|nr:MAG: T9SS type A sorting domain-containing protein [Saprospiraceae bacterium]